MDEQAPDDQGVDERFDAIVRRQKSRLQEWLDGELSTDDLDDEEVEHGFPRNRVGTFAGTGPRHIPRRLYLEMQRRQQEDAVRYLHGSANRAVRALAEVLANEEAADRDRIAAANSILDRTVGRAAEKVDLTVADVPLWQRVASDVRIWRGAEDLQDAEVVEQKEVES